MYDEFRDYDDYPYGAAGGAWSSGDLDRLTHLVLVDGRLVDMWSEPVEGTRWLHHAHRFDRERRPEVIRAEPPKPPYDEMLEWLDLVVGGREALTALSAAPLAGTGSELPLDELDLRSRHRLESATTFLERAADEFPDEEMGIALQRLLAALWTTEPEVVLRARSAGHTAAGVCWAAGRANGSFGPHGPLTQAGLKERLDLPCALSGAGAPIRRALQGFLPVEDRPPVQAPDLLPLRDAGLLTSSTRRMLIRLRDRATAAKQTHERSSILP